MKSIFLLSLSLLLLSIATIGCMPSLNEEHLVGSHEDFNTVIIRSWDEQMLTNLVRLRYRDNPMFLEVGNVVAHQSTSVGGVAGLETELPGKLKPGFGMNGSLVVSPTITYTPLQGEEFARRLLTPIPSSTIFLLSQSGWSIERLMLTCVQQANSIKNAVSAAGPTPELAPTFGDFHRLTEAFRTLQKDRMLQVEMEKDGQTFSLHLNRSQDPHVDSAATIIKELLGLDKEKVVFRVTSKRIPTANDEIALTGRSLLSVLFFLSQSVETSFEDEEQGRVTVTRNAEGKRFEWSSMLGKVMRIHSSVNEPAESAVKVLYRERWFYISDSDLASKTTFNLLSFLFNLQAANKSGADPVMTYPVR